MRRGALFCAVLFFASSTAAWAEPIVNVGDYFFSPGEIRTIPLSVTSEGGLQICGMSLCIQIGDGGLANGGADTTPFITAVDVTGTGTIFESDHEDPMIFPDEPLMWGAEVVTVSYVDPEDSSKVLWGTVPCNGVFAFVTIDTTGATPGRTYDLKLTGVGENILEGGFSTSFVDSAANQLGSITNGSITIIPEPSTIGLLSSMLTAMAVVGLRRRFVRQA